MSNRESPLDFRDSMIRKRLKSIKKLVLILSGKGGVGKSVISATLAALLQEGGFRVGLLDADLFGPSCALLLGAHGPPAEGKRGLTPRTVGGVKVMSLDLFAPGRPFPLTGEGTRQILLELLALTDWGSLDYLIVDMPPATGDIMMTLTSLPKKGLEAVVVATPDILSVSVAHRVLALLKSAKVPIAGVIGNMYWATYEGKDGPQRLSREFHVSFLGRLPYDEGIADAVQAGSSNRLLETGFARSLHLQMRGLLGTRTGPGNRRKGRPRSASP
jgi:ATP-binding protein involved in chromosome partitioning